GALLTAGIALVGCGPSADATADAGAKAEGAAESGEWPDPFVVAVIPSEDRTELEPSDSVQLTKLSEDLGLNIEYHMASSYAATIEAQRSGKAHMAQYGPFSYVLAKDGGVDLVPLVTTA